MPARNAPHLFTQAALPRGRENKGCRRRDGRSALGAAAAVVTLSPYLLPRGFSLVLCAVAVAVALPVPLPGL